MASVTWFDASQPSDVFTLLSAGFSSISNASSTTFRANLLDGSFWVMSGTGFTYDVDDRPTAGTVTSIQVTSGGSQPILEITDTAVPASDVIGWIMASASYSLFTAALAGNDTINGNPSNNSLYGFGGDPSTAAATWIRSATATMR
jgi:hypothetical protein